MVRNTAAISMAVFLLLFLITLKENQLQKLFLRSIWNLEAIFQHIDTRWQVLCISKSEFLTQSIQMQLSQNQTQFSLIFFFSFLHFWSLRKVLRKKKMSPESLCPEIMDCKKRGSLTTQKVPRQNTNGQWTC